MSKDSQESQEEQGAIAPPLKECEFYDAFFLLLYEYEGWLDTPFMRYFAQIKFADGVYKLLSLSRHYSENEGGISDGYMQGMPIQ